MTMLQIVLTIALSAIAVFVGACVVGSENTPRSDPFTLNDAAVAEDMLTVSVSYAGGCRLHEFRLLTADGFMESDPVQLRIDLIHDANGDRCLAWITEQHSFDLSDVKARWREAYRQESGIVQLRLRDAPDDEALRYRF